MYICAKYFKDQGADITNNFDEFDGHHGLMVFNKHNEKNNRVVKKDVSEWIVAIGNHIGVIPSQHWIKAQNILKSNSLKAPRTGSGKVGLLTEFLRCSNCGSKMRVTVYKRKSGTYHYYRCLLKERSRASKCQVTNLNGIQADEYVIDKIKNISYEKDDIYQYLNKLKNNMRYLDSFNYCTKVELEKELKINQEAISNLTQKLSKPMDDAVTKYIAQQIKELDIKIREIEPKIEKLKYDEETVSKNQIDISSLLNIINNFSNHVEELSFNEKKKILKHVVDYITWDGYKLEINILSHDSFNNNYHFYIS